MNTYQPLNLFNNFEHAAELYPNQSIVLDTELLAFPELKKKTTYTAALQSIKERAFQFSKLGVSKGDKVILFKNPAFDTYLLANALSYLGAIPVMVSYHFSTEIMTVFINRLDNPFILFDETTANVVSQLKNSSQEHQISLTRLLEQQPTPVPSAMLSLDEISYMTHTSGTTGIPKLICHSANSMGWRTLWQRTVFEKISEKKGLAFHISPVHSRFNIGVSSAMSLGFPLVVLNSADSQSMLNTLSEHRPFALETHPNNFVQWSFFAKEYPHVFESIQYYHSTFDAINNETMARFLTASGPNATFLQVYGQSECGPMILKKHTLETLPSNNARDMGIGLPGLTQARITDEKGQPLPVGTDGHIQFLSKGRALTYYEEDARFQDNVYDEWWDSGDYGQIDSTGHLYLKDRQVDLIETIESNLAIEDFLLDNLSFLEEVVLVRNAQNQPQPIIAIKDGLTMEWDAWWNQIADLPHLNEPIIRRFEDIPRTATMKVQRLQIEAEIKAGTF